MPEPVELHDAWMWDCLECGVENFVRAIAAAPSREELEDMARDRGPGEGNQESAGATTRPQSGNTHAATPATRPCGPPAA